MDVQASNANEGQLADQVLDSVGVDEGSTAGNEAAEHVEQDKPDPATLSVQKRLKAQKRAHEREVRELHARIGDLEAKMSQPMFPSQDDNADPSIDQHIHKAVTYALREKEANERKAREMQEAQHVQRQYHEFQRHLDGMNDKYDDFHDVVFGQQTPYTAAMRDYALTLPRSGQGSAGEVLYKLGKNPEELERLSKLHPLDQASEMSRLSHALISGSNEQKAQSSRPLGQIKTNPVTNSHRVITDKTPPSEIRARMKAGTWK